MAVYGEAAQNIPHMDALSTNQHKTRVLMIITGLAAGGATNVVLSLADYFSRHPDYDVQLLTGPIPAGRTDVTHRAHELGINTRLVPSLVNNINPLQNMKAVVDIQRIMAQGDFDIVHTHSTVAGVVGRLAALAAGVPVVIHHVHGWTLPDGMPAAIRTVHVGIERFCARYTTRMVVVTKTDITKGLTHRIGKEEQYTLIYNGIDVESFRRTVNEQELRRELGLAPDSKLIGMIGRLDKQKNPLDFIRTADIVARSYPDVQFLIIGDGTLRAACEQLIDELNLKDRVFLLGYRSDVARILPIFTISAMSSLWEGLPIAFLESMSAGKPIVANEVDGACDVVIDGETGFLVPARRPPLMAAKILYLLTHETECSTMGQAAQQRSDSFTLQRMCAQVESLYKETLASAQHHIHHRDQRRAQRRATT